MMTEAILLDVLPLYAEGLLSEASRQWVEENIGNFPHCQEQLAQLQGDLEPPAAEPLDFLSQAVKKEKRRYGWAIFAACLSLVIIIVTSLTLPLHLNNDGKLYTLTQTDDQVTLIFDASVRHLTVSESMDVDGQEAIVIDGYTTALDQLFPKTYQLSLTRPASEKIFYENHGRAADVITGNQTAPPMVLPRLVLNYYALMVLAATLLLLVFLGCRILIFKKRPRVTSLVYLLTGPLSFFVAWLTITGLSGNSHYPSHEATAILLLTGAYALLLLSLYRLKTNRL